ncbi:MAG: hypothetical protein WCH65_07750, partial [bacterium]
ILMSLYFILMSYVFILMSYVFIVLNFTLKKILSKHIDFILTQTYMFSQIKTLLTDHSSTCITHANKLAYTNNQRTIQGEDVIWGISLYLKHHKLHTIFWKLLDIPEEIIDEYFQNKYTPQNNITTKKETKQLPLNKRLSHLLKSNINETTKELDVDILFMVSLQDLSIPFTNHVLVYQKEAKNIVAEYKKLTKNPMIMKM